MNFIYIRYLSKHFQAYINYYSKCEFNQIKRYKSYENMILINKSKISFHIIIMNFIIALSLITNDFDNLFIIINKFFKRVLLTFEKIIYIAAK